MSEIYQGLSSSQASLLLKKNGLNSLPEKKKNIFIRIVTSFFSPVPLMLIVAALLSLYTGNVVNFWIIIFLFFSNFTISFWHERKADTSIAQLQKKLTIKVCVFRDGMWTTVDSMYLVEGDIINLEVGSVVPADAIILKSRNLSINESMLTGESFPKEKKEGDISYSGSYVTTGDATCRVTATGIHTFFGKTIVSIDTESRQSSLEVDILSISKFISIVCVVVMLILTGILIVSHVSYIEIITLDLSLLIAGIPVALPTVMSLIISIGVFELSRKQVIVRRLASLEDLANVDLLLSDKTGTLTQNTIQIERVTAFQGYTEKDVLIYAASAVSGLSNSPLDQAVLMKAKELSLSIYSQDDHIPGDSERKRATSTITVDGIQHVVTFGAPQIVEMFCTLDISSRESFNLAVQSGARDGYRSLAVAINTSGTEEKDMRLVGILFFADSLHTDAKATMEFMQQNGIDVKMITGDSIEISKRVARELRIEGEICSRVVLDGDRDKLEARFDFIGGFAEVLPKDKYDIVSLARKYHVVAMTGDGVNDLPAVKNADVGFAVNSAVDALKSGADIVLLKDGISVIKDAIVEARKIFARLYNYSLYRISESFRVIITIAVIGLIYKTYPLTPIQLIVLAFLNDVPIISLAFDRVQLVEKPAHIDVKKRFALSTLFGLTGTANSLILLFIMVHYMHASWDIIQTVFFLKLTVSGHMLIYVAHTKEWWFRYIPSNIVICTTIATQLIATIFALTGFLTTPIPLTLVVFVWGWSFIWMQISELMKHQKWITV